LRLAAALAIAAGLAACGGQAPQMVDFSEARRNYRPEDYNGVLKSWTRHARVVSDVGTVIEMWGTFKSWSFRQAYVEQWAQVYGLADSERETLYAAQLEAARRYYEFHVAVQTTSYKWNDLEKDASAWRISLLDGTGAEIRPKLIRVEKLPEPYEERFFPYRTPFTRTYLIRFDRTEAERDGFTGTASGRLVLRTAGPLGRADLVWQSK
jgi:hypothetical protein